MELNPIFKTRLTDDGNIPLYSQLINVIKRSISSGLLAAGDLLPSEAEMIEFFGISRSTVRRAMGALEEEGLIVRKRGRGTFVAEPALTRRVENIWSFTSEVTAMGKTPSSTLISFELITPALDIAGKLELARADIKVYKFTRIRRVNGEPLMLETSYYPEYIYPGLTREQVEENSMYSLLFDAGIVPGTAEDTYEVIRLSREDVELLQCRRCNFGFYHQRRCATEGGEVFEFTRSVIRGDRVRLDVLMQKDGVVFSRSFD